MPTGSLTTQTVLQLLQANELGSLSPRLAIDTITTQLLRFLAEGVVIQ